jgi:hypothetical protein
MLWDASLLAVIIRTGFGGIHDKAASSGPVDGPSSAKVLFERPLD